MNRLRYVLLVMENAQEQFDGLVAWIGAGCLRLCKPDT